MKRRLHQSQQQKQKMSPVMVYAVAGSATLLIVFGILFAFNIGNIRSALAGGTTTVLWQGKSSSDWTDKRNWQKNKLPSNGDNIAINGNYKYAPVIKGNSPFNVYDINMTDGAELTIEGNLDVKDDITIRGRKTKLTVKSGNLAVTDHIFLENKGELYIKGGATTVGDDVTLTEGEVEIDDNKASLTIENALEIEGNNCTFYLKNGSVTVKKDLVFHGDENKSTQLLQVDDGTFTVKGATRFYRTDASYTTDQKVWVKGGSLEFQQLVREPESGSAHPANFHFVVEGGMVDFKEDVMMNQWKGNSNLSSAASWGKGKKKGSITPCDQVKIKKWNKGTYNRKGTEQILVEYKDKVYRLKPSVYWSKNHEPDQSPSYWEEYKCEDLCSSTNDWDSYTTYSRNKGGDELYVLYEGELYKMKENVWWSENHLPDEKKSKYWEHLGKCYEYTPLKCGNTPLWVSTTEYRRKNQNEVIEVSYEGYKYTLLNNVWYSKNNKPAGSPKYWKKGDACGGSSGGITTDEDDKFVHDGGRVVFHKKWQRPRGFQSKNDGVVHFKNTNDTMSLQVNEKFINLVIDADVQLKLEGDIEVQGSITNYSSKKPRFGKNRILLNGNGNQTITGSNELFFEKLEINKRNGKVMVDQDITINDKLILTSETIIETQEKSGNKRSSEAVIIFEDGATWEGDGWIEGKVRKNGSDAFTFPIGKDGRPGNLSISAPSNPSSYDAEYFTGNHNPKDIGTGLVNVSTLEYWTLDKISGDDVSVTLHWDNGAWSQITDETEIMVARYDGANWVAEGRDSHTGGTNQGSVTSAGAPSSHGYFTFGSNSNHANALPVELISFSAERRGENVLLQWATAEEIDNEHFEIQRSTDGVYFEVIGIVKGKGTISGRQDYVYEDVNAPEVRTYYRMKQVDFSGDFEYKGGVVSVNGIGEVGGSASRLLIQSVGPNPFVNQFTVQFNSGASGNGYLRLVSLQGNEVLRRPFNAAVGINTLQVQAGQVPSGYYIVEVVVNQERDTKKIMKQ